MKVLFWIVGIILALLTIASVIIGFYIGPLAKMAIEKIGPQVTKVTVQVDSVGVSLLTGSATIKDFVLGNPSGFSTPQAVKVGTIAVSVDPSSVMSQKIVVHSLKIVSPDITFEGGLTGNNLSKIASNANSNSQTPTGTDNKPAPKIEVDDLQITGAHVHVSVSGLGGREVSLPLPTIHLTDLGKNTNGMTANELARAILTSISTGTVKAVASSATGLGNGLVGGGLNQITSGIGNLFGK